MKGRLLSYHDELIKMFKNDIEFSAAYLSHTLKNKNSHRFLNVLKDMLEARVGSLSAVAKKTKLSKKQLEHVFSDEVNPLVDTMIKLFNVLDLQFTIPEANLATKAKRQVATKAKKRVVASRKKAILPPAIKTPSAQVPNQPSHKATAGAEMAKKAKSTQPSLKIRRARKK